MRKARRTFYALQERYNKKYHRIPAIVQEQIEREFDAIEQAIANEERKEAIRRLKKLANGILKKSLWEQLRENGFALLAALGIAIIIRQMGFELYEIPTGSMRPTFKEKDRLLTSKTFFGWNLPLTASHIFFNPERVMRNSIITFTGKGLDIRDVDTKYFYLFPGKKQFVKRVIGKPGDVLYFYGGKIYGIDAQGKDISQELQMFDIEHIPFIDFVRKTRFDGNIITFYQMNLPIAKLHCARSGFQFGEMLDRDGAAKDIYELWGMGNFAMARLLTHKELEALAPNDAQNLEDGRLYLEIKHHPSIAAAQIKSDEFGNLYPFMGVKTSFIPLQEEHLRALWSHMETSRFHVKDGIAYCHEHSSLFGQVLPGIPDGCYEFFSGKGYSVHWEGIVEELPHTHPLMQFSPERLQTFFNLGIVWDVRFHPIASDQRLIPNRYAYFRDGDLYLLGAPILKKGDPVLNTFLEREKAHSYPFVDRGPPLTQEGLLDVAFVQRNGLPVPAKMYLLLGDNHANSGDSREFGFVPEGNLRGSPILLFWPFGKRFGFPLQAVPQGVNMYTAIFWGIVGGAIVTITWIRKRKRMQLLDYAKRNRHRDGISI